MELDNGGDRRRRANGGLAAVGGPANHGEVRGERVGDRSADAARREGLREEGGGGEVHPGSDGRGEENRVQAECGEMDEEGQGSDAGRREL